MKKLLIVIALLLGCSPAMRPRTDGGSGTDDAEPLPDGGGPVADVGRPPSDDAAVVSSDAGPPVDAWTALHLPRTELGYHDLDVFREAGSPEASVLYPDGTLRSSGPTTRSVYTRPFAACSPTTGTGPANCLTWGEAFALCAYRGLRLPTESEWLSEAGEPGPDEVRDAAGPEDPLIRFTHRCPASARICDTRGNVSEWVVGEGPVLFVAMGESYRSAETRREDPAPDAEIGVRCWGRAR